MSNEATAFGAPAIPLGARWALAVVVFLAILAAFIALNLPGDISIDAGSNDTDGLLHDYGLRHPPQQSASSGHAAPVRMHDYALRHVPWSGLNSPDYALRHPTG